MRHPWLGSEGAVPATGRLFRQRRAAILPQGLLGAKGVVSRLRRGRRVCARPQCWKRFVCTCASAWGWTVSLWRMGRSGWLPLRRGGECPEPSLGFLLPACPGGWPGGADRSLSPPSGKDEAGRGAGDRDRIEGPPVRRAGVRQLRGQTRSRNSTPDRPRPTHDPRTRTVYTVALGCLCLHHLALWDLGSRANFPATLRGDLSLKIGVCVCQGEEGAMPPSPQLPPAPPSQTFRGSS